MLIKKVLATKARFARARAARGWILAYQATSIDLTLQSHTLDPTSGLSFLRLVVPIRLLVKDKGILFIPLWTQEGI